MKTFTARSWRLLPIAAALLLPVAALAQLPTAAQVAAQINVGYNIGNSLEVPGGETGWGNPAVNQALVNAVKAAGFNAIRIPCAWDSHANQSTMTIDAAWLARVKEVVDYAISNGMYVVLNEHWDGGWLEEHPLYAYQTSVNAKQKAYWTQIANYFKAYDQHLLFAGTNEVHADYGTPTTENITVQQSFNQTFVDAVRATGGNNATRPLVVQTYNTNIQHGLNYFSLPTDSAQSRLIVEVHYYDPYDFTLNSSGSCLYWGAPYPTQAACTWAYESYVDSTFASVNQKWVAKGVPVIIGEYGVATRSGLDLGARAYWLKYVNQAAAKNGIKTFYWDNGVVGNNGFALFNRTTGAIVDQQALTAVMQGAGVGNPTVNYTLATSASGSGSVSVSPAGTSFAGGTSITLTATPAAGSQFSGWSGSFTGSTNPLVFKISANTSVTANFVPQGSMGTGTILREWWLNVYGGTISGLTSSAAYPNSPSGSQQLTSIEGPTNFADSYGTRIRGYVHPPTTGAYTFWIASDDVGELWLSTSEDPALATRIAYNDQWTNSREWTKYASQKSAAINLVAGQKYYLEVRSVEGGGGDNVAVAWQGPSISQSIPSGIYISPFVPSSTPTSYALTVAKAGTGAGTVAAGTAINCGTVCSATYASGTVVTLTATAATGSTFAGWSGACTSTTATCTVTMSAARTVTATFNPVGTTSYTLTVAKAGTGTGTVAAGTAISCGTTCSASYASGTIVTLTATAATGSTFAGWSGACTSATGTCAVTMSAARTVTATFNPVSSGTTPCANPVTFTGNTGNFNSTGAACFRTTQTVNGWGCSNFDGRTISVNGGTATASCGAGPFPLPKSSDGYTYFSATAGTYPWASIYLW